MTLGFGKILPPRVKSMAAKQETVNGGVAFQQRLDLLSQLRGVLGILEDRKDFPMLVRTDVAQALKHLESLERHDAIGCKRVRKQSAPHRMRVQYRAGTANADNCKVQSSFRRGQAVPPDYTRCFVDFQELLRVKRAFVQSRGRDRQAQWPLAHDCAEISARSEQPSALIETPSDLRKGSRQILKASARFTPAGTSRRLARGALPGTCHGSDYRMPGLPTKSWLCLNLAMAL